MDSNTFQLHKEPLNLNYIIFNVAKDYLEIQEQQKARDIIRLISNVNSNNNKNNDSYSKKIQTKLLFEPRVKEDIFVKADKERLMQVMCNLLDNAFKFTDSDGSTVLITLEKQEQQLGDRIPQERHHYYQQQQEPHAIIRIKDTGTGIDPEILPRLFSKFATKSQKGTGLGLYISKNIVEAHGGKLYAKNNTNDKGATFTIILPLFKQ
jgi:two-component system, OmpR family, sensor histidine kinase VicK